MKVAVRFQFYFPYVFPRAHDWDGQVVAFRLSGFTARVRPRRTNEDLFPDDLDRTLSTMRITLARRAPPNSDTTMVVRDICYDRLEVIVDGDVPSLDDARTAEIQEQFEFKAIQAANLFLDQCRVLARSPFVLGVQRQFHLEDQRYYVLTPRTVAWFDGQSGTKMPVFEGGTNGQTASGAIPSPERGTATMEAMHASLSKGVFPQLAQSLLLDAEAALVTLRIREAVLG